MTPVHGSDADYRLPRHALPRRYELTFRPDLPARRLEGTASIELQLVERSDELVCNAAELAVRSAALRPLPAMGEAVTLEVELRPETERMAMHAPRPLEPGDYVLELEFEGTLNDKLRGFYLSTFEGPDGETREMAATQFESTDARRAFPCWDEPDRKAVFSVAVEIAPGLRAVSNARQVDESELAGGHRRVQFADTVPMSTYLVCLVVGPLESTEPVEVAGVPLAVVAPVGRTHLAGFALEAASHALEWFAEYYGLPYPGDKMDLVDVPDFAMGAMENLGCVTFREVYLLCDPETSSIPEREVIAEVIEHELAHMWFGDLVTMKWWNGIWLNEAFATYMARRCLEDFRPEWKPWVSFGREKDAGLAIDGLHTTRPIEFPVRDPEEAEAMFDVITYQKGGNVLRMLERYLGEERFREGVRRYLSTHKFANTETTDLWDAIESVAGGEPVRALMDSWIFQGGFPLVTAAIEDGRLVLDSQPFSYLPLADWERAHPGEPSAIGRDWIVPVLVADRTAPVTDDEEADDRFSGSVVARLLGPAPNAEHPIHLPVGDSLPVVNAGGGGTYRLRYTGTLFDQVVSQLDRLTALERYNLVSDTWATTVAGATGLGDFFALVAHLRGEPDPNVWGIVAGALSLCDLAVAEADRGRLEEFVRSVVRPELERVGREASDGEAPEAPRSRAIFVTLLGSLGADEDVSRWCRGVFVSAQRDGRLPADTAEAVLRVVAYGAGKDEFHQMLHHVRHPVDPIDGERYLFALPSLRDLGLADELRRLCLTEIRTQNAPHVLRMLLQNRVTGPETWRFVADRLDEMDARFPTGSVPLLLGGVARLAQIDEEGTPVLAREVAERLGARDFGGHKRGINQHLERLLVNVRFVTANRPILGELLQKT